MTPSMPFLRDQIFSNQHFPIKITLISSASVKNNFATNSWTSLSGLQVTKVISKRKQQHNILFKWVKNYYQKVIFKTVHIHVSDCNNSFIYNLGFLWNEQITNRSLYCTVLVVIVVSFFALFILLVIYC